MQITRRGEMVLAALVLLPFLVLLGIAGLVEGL